MSEAPKKRFGWGHLIFVVALILVLWGISMPPILRSAKAGARTEALNNAKAIAGGMVSFKTEYGAYPCDAIREKLKEDGFKNLPSGTCANSYLAQLIVTDIIDSETYFYAPGVDGTRKGDDRKDSAETILSAGENSFAYIMTLNGEPLSDVSSITPLVMAAIKHPGIVPIFNTEIYADKYVYGAVDGSGKVGDLNEHGNAMSKGRVHLLETGEDSLFGDEFPVLTFPRLPNP